MRNPEYAKAAVLSLSDVHTKRFCSAAPRRCGAALIAVLAACASALMKGEAPPQKPFQAGPAALKVITQEHIRPTGARNIPETLRLEPGLEVAVMNSGFAPFGDLVRCALYVTSTWLF
jgi:hypothetical protein